jgi:glycine cleavage system H lipoate-binding protein
MQCPFLRKMNVKYCGLCRLTKIPLQGTDLAAEQCSGPDYKKCTLVHERHEGPLPTDGCPFLSVSDVHYCEVAPFQKLIPCNQTTVSRCKNEGHKYCQLYLSMTETTQENESTENSEHAAETEPNGEDVSLPDSLAYAPNHMWLDRGDGRTCHVGIDAFFARALGHVDEVSYPQHGENRRPMVRFRVGGVDFDLVFPNVMQGTEINAHLVADPMEVLRDPYGRGWLFEGVTVPAPETPHPLEAGLLRGMAARNWMRLECERLAGFVHEHVSEHSEETGLLAQDGGGPVGVLAEAMDRRTLIRLHSEFFTLRIGRTAS